MEPNETKTLAEVMAEHNDEKSVEMAQKLNDLIQEKWNDLVARIEGAECPVMAITFSIPQTELNELLGQYLKPDENGQYNIDVVVSVYVKGESEDLAIDMEYYYGGFEFQPDLICDRDVTSEEAMIMRYYDHIPSSIELLQLAIDVKTNTPVFRINPSAEGHEEIQQVFEQAYMMPTSRAKKLQEQSDEGGVPDAPAEGKDDASPTPDQGIPLNGAALGALFSALAGGNFTPPNSPNS